MRRLRKFLLLSMPERILVLRALLLTVGVAIALRFVRFGSLLAYAGCAVRKEGPRALDPRRTAHWVDACASFLGANCLVRSLVLARVLRSGGTDAELRIGVTQSDGALQAHAWVEVAGVPVNDAVDIGLRYAMMPTSGGTHAWPGSGTRYV